MKIAGILNENGCQSPAEFNFISLEKLQLKVSYWLLGLSFEPTYGGYGIDI